MRRSTRRPASSLRVVSIRLERDSARPRASSALLPRLCATEQLRSSSIARRRTASQRSTLSTIDSFPIPLPPTLDEQREIVAVLDAIDRKIDLHRRKRAVLDELFKALLHKLMTGEIRVADLDLSALDAEPIAEVAA